MAGELSLAERAKIERNRQNALLKLERKRRFAKMSDKEIISDGTTFIDSNSGFLIDKTINKIQNTSNTSQNTTESDSLNDYTCQSCLNQFTSSYLMKNFDLMICNKCREPAGQHKLINKTLARDVYLLNETDLGKRQPVLKFIIKPNPKNSSWGDMKLYLECQVAERSLEVWGSPEQLEAERKRREENVDKMKIVKYQRSVRALREETKAKEMRFDTGGHVHEYSGTPEYDSEKDLYQRTCDICGYVDCYEIM